MAAYRLLLGRRTYAMMVIVVSLLLRWKASLGEFWLDEIWTWGTIQSKVHSTRDVFFNFLHDNNHLLNTWLIYLMGPDCSWTTYRLPAVFFGTMTVILAGVWGMRNGKASSMFSMLLVGGSYLMIHYSSEARGYAPLLCFCLLGRIALERGTNASDDRSRLKWWTLWNVSVILGMLSHLTFVIFYGAALIWTLPRIGQTHRNWRSTIAWIARWNAIPILFSAWFYLQIVSHFVVGGGLSASLGTVVSQALSLTIGGPMMGPAMPAVAACVAVAMMTAMAYVYRNQQKDDAIFNAVVIVIIPAMILLSVKRFDLSIRYFLVSILFLQLLFGQMLGTIWDGNSKKKVIAGLVMLTILLGNAVHVNRLFQLGRGNYLAALELISRKSVDGRAVLGSDHDFHHRLLIGFYQQYLVVPTPIILYGPDWPNHRPEWLLTHNFERDWQPDRTIEPVPHHEYRLQDFYPYAGLSGWGLAIYRRENAD